jgi:hypothetical protein
MLTIEPKVSFLFSYGAGVDSSPLILLHFIGHLEQPWMIDGDDDCRAINRMSE